VDAEREIIGVASRHWYSISKPTRICMRSRQVVSDLRACASKVRSACRRTPGERTDHDRPTPATGDVDGLLFFTDSSIGPIFPVWVSFV